VRKAMQDIRNESNGRVSDGMLGDDPWTPGREAVRLAHMATAMHLSQAAPLLAGVEAPMLWTNSTELVT
jgi:hypothetical protein